MKRKFLHLMVLLFIFFIPACSLGGDETPEPEATNTPARVTTPTATPTTVPPKPEVNYIPVAEDILSPIIVSRNPQRGENLAPDGAIELVFDQDMNQEAVAKSLTLQQAGNTASISGEGIWVNNRTFRFQPNEPLSRATTYDVVLTQDAVAGSGDPLREPFIFRFETTGFLEVGQVIPAPDTQDVETDSTITVMFNRPVVPLTTLAEMENLPNPVTFEPEIKGEGEWLNTSIYIFKPAEPLAGGLTYTAKVSAGLEDTVGSILADDYIWQFTTIPPKVVWHNPRNNAKLVDINTPLTVEFNQPVSVDSARESFRLSSGTIFKSSSDGKFEVISNTLTFTPSQSLDFDTTYTVQLGAGITSVAGGKGMIDDFSWEFTTVPLPRIVETFPGDGEQNAWPHTDFRIVFNTPIDAKTVMPNLDITPVITSSQVYTYFSEYDNTFHLGFGSKPSTDYTFVIGDGIADPYGNTIPRGATVDFRTAPIDPNYQLRVPDLVSTYDASQPARVVVGYVNVNRLDFTLYKLPIESIERPYWEWYDNLPGTREVLREWTQNLEAPLNKQSFVAIGLTETPGGTLEPGVYLLDVDDPDNKDNNGEFEQRHVLVVSNINLTLKSAPKEMLVWATDLASGAPVSNLTLTVSEYNRGNLEKITTDAQGIARLPLKQYHDSVVVYSEEPFAAIADQWGRGISPWDFGMGEGLYVENYQTYIYLDRPIYRPGQKVYFKGIIRAEDDAAFKLADIGEAKITIFDAAYEEIFGESLQLSELGSFSGEVTLADEASLGQYVIAVEFAGQYIEQRFQVAAYRPPEFEVNVTTEKDEIQRGEGLTVTLETTYFFGGPLANAEVEWNILAENYYFKPPQGGRFTFTDVDDPYICFDCWWWSDYEVPESILSGNGKTDAQGQLILDVDGTELEEALTQRGARLTIEASASGPDNQVISGRKRVTVHPGPYYIGLSPREYVGQAGDESDIDLVVVDWDGERLPNKAIKVEFYEREWLNTFIENDFGGGYWSWETKETLVEEQVVTTNNLGETTVTFVPPKGGSYHVVVTPDPVVAEVGTEDIRSSIFIWVAGENYVSWRRENHDRISLISDKATYQVGDTAEILIPSPFEAPHQALITIERGGILRYEVITLESNSHLYRLPITEGDIPNIYISAVLMKGRTGDSLADFKMGLLPVDVTLEPKTLALQIEANSNQAEPGEDVTYTITATQPDGQPAVGAELSFDVVDKAVLSLQPRNSDILGYFYARRALQVNSASGLSLSANQYLEELAEDLELDLQDAGFGGGGPEALEADGSFDDEFMGLEGEMAMEEKAMAMDDSVTSLASVAEFATGRAANVAPPAGVDIREAFADTAFWTPLLVTDEKGQVEVQVTLPDNLTTWVMRGVGLTARMIVGEATSDLVATKPLLVRPVAPRFFVVEDRAQLAANVSNNTDQDLSVEVSLSAEGVGISNETPPQQTVTIAARSETKVTWNVSVDDVTETQLIFSAVSGEYGDASKPRLATGPDGSLRVFRYTAPDIVGTAGQLTEGGSRIEAIALPPEFDDRRGQLTVQLDPSLAASMRDGLSYLEHYEYECTEQTISRFLPNVLTFNALQSLGIENDELASRLPDLVDTGLDKVYKQQNPDGGWGWWYRFEDWHSNPHVSAYVVFALLKVQQTGVEVKEDVLDKGLAYLKAELLEVRDYKNIRNANQQAWLLYVLAEAKVAPSDKLDTLYDNREKLSHYGQAYLAQSLWLSNQDDSRLETLLSDLNNAAILSATGAHWEENEYDWWAMNTDTRSTAIILDTLAKLDPDNALIPNVVRWLMVARQVGVWETTQETAWAIIALTDWMVVTGELDANYDYALYLNEVEQVTANVSRETVQESTKVTIPVADLVADATNALAIARTDGNGRLYYSAHLEVFLPVEEIEPADRGIIVSRRYTLADCTEGLACPEVREAKLGDVIRVDLTIVAPNDLYYLVIEDPLPAGGEAIDTGLATTSLLAMDPTLSRQESRYWWWWHWYSRSELRDEKVVLFADYLSKGTYEYSYTFRATLPGDYHVIPTVAREFYFPEVFGRSSGRLLSIGE